MASTVGKTGYEIMMDELDALKGRIKELVAEKRTARDREIEQAEIKYAFQFKGIMNTMKDETRAIKANYAKQYPEEVAQARRINRKTATIEVIRVDVKGPEYQKMPNLAADLEKRGVRFVVYLNSRSASSMGYITESGQRIHITGSQALFDRWIDEARKIENEEYGCRNCLYAGAECKHKEYFAPKTTVQGKPSCAGYVYFD